MFVSIIFTQHSEFLNLFNWKHCTMGTAPSCMYVFTHFLNLF